MTKRIPKDQQKKRGRPSFKRTEAIINEVETCLRLGMTHVGVASYLGISDKTLEKYFPNELRQTKVKMLVNGVNKLHINVLNGDQRAIEFLLNTQGREFGWGREIGVTGPGGKDLFADLDLSKLDDGKLDALCAILRAAGAVIPDSLGAGEKTRS